MKKILLIEDDRPTIELYEEILKKAKFEVEVLEWGKDGLAALDAINNGKKEKPDLVLLDLILPDINGIEVLRKAKKDEKLKDIPFFVLTNYSDVGLEKESLRLGAEEYLVKANYTPAQIVKAIKEQLKK
jgi:CheY-like chemotaxis protein